MLGTSWPLEDPPSLKLPPSPVATVEKSARHATRGAGRHLMGELHNGNQVKKSLILAQIRKTLEVYNCDIVEKV